MNRKSWMFLTVVLACSFVGLFMSLSAKASTRYGSLRPGVASISGINPTPEATEHPVFSATMYVIPEKTELVVGELLNVRISIEVSEGCQYPIYELKLTQDGEDGSIFKYISPITQTVGPGVPNPFTYTLQAEIIGTTKFHGLAYGERFCGDYWNWTYIEGTSKQVAILEYEYQIYLPVIEKDL